MTYFSRAGINMVAGRQQQLVVGNTARVAIAIADKVSVATNTIEAVEPYPDSYQLTLARARREADQQTWPPVERTPMRVGKVLLLGFPIWGGDLPRPVATWLRQTQLSGVTIYRSAPTKQSLWHESDDHRQSLSCGHSGAGTARSRQSGAAGGRGCAALVGGQRVVAVNKLNGKLQSRARNPD
ncbi:hypothetical protein [Lacticaseibacillus pantheris]|uniref:hypothetical protein n=1 Tax=Lacticaseibacillus pantheris TaxID=171523 RepID=UPI0012E2B4AC|nr:hypothetical protein [Lacticaseibacillus pantheris]